jgi:Skp family chaperone for outer membrane proteins
MTTRMGFRIAAGIAAVLLTVAVQAVFAQNSTAGREIATVDVRFLLRHAAVAKDVRAKINAAGNKIQQGLERKLNAVSEDFARLEKLRAKLPEETYLQQLTRLRSKVEREQGIANTHQQELINTERIVLQEIAATVEGVVDKIIMERRLRMVITKSSIIGSAAIPDISAEVLKRLNQQMPEAKIKIPKQ